jgi:peptide/nickel transport system permease protein
MISGWTNRSRCSSPLSSANAVQGEFGVSLSQGRKVATLITERFPATLELAFVAALIALLAGIPMGVYAALRRGHWLSQLMMTFSLLGVSLPTFLIGILLILVFAVTWKWLPSFGRGDVIRIGGWSTGLLTPDGWKHLVLPAVTLSIFQLALILRLVRARCWRCCAPTTSSSPAPVACPTGWCTSATR